MPYKISGNLSDASKIIVVKESNWETEITSDETAGNYEVAVSSGEKLLTARKSDGHSISFGNVIPETYAGDRGIFFPGHNTTEIQYITISSIGNASDFGDAPPSEWYGHDAVSNGASDRGVLAGGQVDAAASQRNNIEYITISSIGNSTDFGDLTLRRTGVASCDSGTSDKGLFFGGSNTPGTTIYNEIDYITISSIGDATDFGDISTTSRWFAGTSNDINDRGVWFGGVTGVGGGATRLNIIEYVTISSPADSTDFGDMLGNRGESSCTSNGTSNRGIVASGNGSGGYLDTIEYITINSLSDASAFGNLSGVCGYGSACSNKTNQRGVLHLGASVPVNVLEYITITSLGDSIDFGDLSSEAKTYSKATSNA